MKKKYVVIGTSAAAIGATNRLLQIDVNCSIILISDEKENPYNKCFLADYVIGNKHRSELHTLTNKPLDSRVCLLLGTKIIEIDVPQKCAITAEGKKIPYDVLLIATGSRSRLPDNNVIKDVLNVKTFHSLADIEFIVSYIHEKKCSKITIIGAGITGLEAADALRSKSVEITLIEKNEYLLPFLPEEISFFIQRKIERSDIKVQRDTTINGYDYAEDRIRAIYTSSGMIETDLIIFAIGVSPNSELALQAGISCKEGSILVDDYLQTSVADIYAAGDVIVTKNQLNGHLIKSASWPDAMLQGSYAAYAMAGQPKKYPGIVPYLSSSFCGVKFAWGGIVGKNTIFNKKIQLENLYEYYALNEAGQLQGFIQAGQTINPAQAHRALQTQELFCL